MNDVASLESLSPHIHLRGLEIPKLSFAQWQNLGRSLNLCGTAQKWWFGDWIIAGESQFKDKAVQAAAEILKIDDATMATVVSVCRRFPPMSRTHNVGFEMYREVWPLKEGQWEGWLIKAEQNGWNRAKLREELKAAGLRRDYKKAEDKDPELIRRTTAEMLNSLEGDMGKALILIPEMVNLCVAVNKAEKLVRSDYEQLDGKIEEVRFALLLLQEDAQALIKTLK